MYRTSALIVAAIVAIPAPAGAGVPQSMCVQGYLEDLAGNPVDGQVTFEVCIYDANTNGIQLWCSAPMGVQVEDALFALVFGDGLLDASIFGGPRWLEISTDGEAMEPRIELRTVPYAFQASNADMLDNKDSSEFLLVSESPALGFLLIDNIPITVASQIDVLHVDETFATTKPATLFLDAWLDLEFGAGGNYMRLELDGVIIKAYGGSLQASEFWVAQVSPGVHTFQIRLHVDCSSPGCFLSVNEPTHIRLTWWE